MAVVVVNEIPDGNQSFYDQVSRQVLPNNQLPEGCQVHIAGPTDSGWRVITVWESEDKFQQFRDNTLIPAIREAGGDQFIAPQIEPRPVHRLLTA